MAGAAVAGGGREVVVLDDDDLVRRGLASVFAEADGFSVRAAAPLVEALVWSDEWDGVEVVVLDAYDAGEPFDRFSGVRLVQRLRQHAGERGARPTVVVVSGCATNPFLRLRMAQAGADLLLSKAEVDAAVLLRAASGARTGAPVCSSHRLPRASGLNDLLDDLRRRDLGDAFRPGLTQDATGLSRRQVMALRREVQARGGLEPDPTLRGGGPGVRGAVPTWRAVVDYVNRARGAELRGPAGWAW